MIDLNLVKSNFASIKNKLPPSLKLYYCYSKNKESFNSDYNNNIINNNDNAEKKILNKLYLKNVEKNTLHIEVENYAYKLANSKPIDIELVDKINGIWLTTFNEVLGKLLILFISSSLLKIIVYISTYFLDFQLKILSISFHDRSKSYSTSFLPD
jgi:hypothetical protein